MPSKLRAKHVDFSLAQPPDAASGDASRQHGAAVEATGAPQIRLHGARDPISKHVLCCVLRSHQPRPHYQGYLLLQSELAVILAQRMPWRRDQAVASLADKWSV